MDTRCSKAAVVSNLSLFAVGTFPLLGNQIWASAFSIGDTEKSIAGGSERHIADLLNTACITPISSTDTDTL